MGRDASHTVGGENDLTFRRFEPPTVTSKRAIQRRLRIPTYGYDGTSLGFRSREAAERLIAANRVTPVYGRKGRLRAIRIPAEDGSHPVETRPRAGTKYSFQQHLTSGQRCWKLKKLDLVDEDGVRFSTEGIYHGVLFDCLPK